MLNDEIQKMKYDSRLFEFQLRHGFITKEEIEKYLSSLKDESANAVKLQLFEENQANGRDESSSNLN